MYLNLTIERKIRKETLTEVAKYLGISRQAYSSKERGESEFSIKEIERLLERYDKPFEELFKRHKEVS